MKIQVWYTELFDGEWEGANDIEFETLADAWNFFMAHKTEHKNDRNWMLTVDGTQIA